MYNSSLGANNVKNLISKSDYIKAYYILPELNGPTLSSTQYTFKWIYLSLTNVLLSVSQT